jgi:thiamine-phosphate pyrophosphorylase
MAHQTSPGVDRAVDAAKQLAGDLDSPDVRLVHYLLALLGEEDGRPQQLLSQLGLQQQHLADQLREARHSSPNVPLKQLLDAARDWSVARRADPTIMTDALLLAILRAKPEWPAFDPFKGLARRIEELLGLESSPVAAADEPPVSFDDPPPGQVDAARAIDANLNRGREALRVIEDYCRFVLNDRFLTEEVKTCRHALAEASKKLPQSLLMAGRESLRDVGTSATAAGEYHRAAPRDVAIVNFKRLQESLRSLEEFGKLFGSDLGRDLEAIRYRVYTLERAFAIGSKSRDRLKDANLYVLLTGSQCSASLDWTIERAAAGGANIFQLREKGLTDRELLERARNVRRWTRKAGVLFIVNDRPDIAKLAEADGVHLGQDDLPVMEARRILGPDVLLGVSTHSMDQVRRAVLDGADYLGIGPTFPSKTKSFGSFPGLAFVREALAETTLPAFALGGIDPTNIDRVVSAGAKRIAVSSCIAAADDPEAVAMILKAALSPVL